MTYCLDTNIIIAIKRKKRSVIQSMMAKNRDQLLIPDIVRAELYVGCLKSNQPTKERAKIDLILAPLKWLPFAGDAVEHYASIRSDLEKAGQIIGPNDLLIAATARAQGAVMVTANVSEFKRVPGLVVEDWTQ